MSIDTRIPKLDKDYNVVGETTIPEARSNGWPRFVVRVFIVDETGNILLQQRSSSSYAFPDVWDLAGAGHIDCGETSLEAAQRELYEEVGIATELKLLEENEPLITETDHVVASIYLGLVSAGIKVTPNMSEVKQVAWCTPQQIDTFLQEKTRPFMPGFTSNWRKHRDTLIA